MIKLLLFLERKRQRRGSKTTLDIVVKVFKWLAIVYFSAIFFFVGFGASELIEEFYPNRDVIELVSQFMVYYFVFELTFRFFFQKLPITDLKPLLIQAIPRNTIIRFFLGKNYISIFNLIQFLFLIPFTITCMAQGVAPLNLMVWVVAMYCLVCTMHFAVILMESYNWIFYTIVALVALIGGSQYYGWFDATLYTQPLFYAAYQYPVSILGYVALPCLLVVQTFRYYRNNMYLDNLIADKIAEGQTQEMAWLDRFGKQALFLKNDIRLIIRNKRAKTTILMSLLFIFYGFLLVRSQEEIDLFTMVLSAYMVTGGFMMMFGQYVPSWDSSYYPLLMTQNVKYVDYLHSKWLLMAVAIVISSILGSMYLFFYVELFYVIVGMAVYNIGITSFIVLVGGAYLKSPVDLTANKNVFGDKNAFNLRLLVLAIPQMLFPLVVFWLGYWPFGIFGGVLSLVLVGVIGIMFRNIFFEYILSLYVKEKYSTIHAFKKG